MRNSSRILYFDHAATTRPSLGVIESMQPYFSEYYANPSASYSLARESRQAIEWSRQMIADTLSVPPGTIIFTSGGTESNNLAIFGIAEAHKHCGRHIITSAIEHPSVLRPLEKLEKNGFEVTYLPVNSYGEVSISDIRGALRPDTILISIMYVNNEIGTIEPIEEIYQAINVWRQEYHTVYPFFHSDVCQATNYLFVKPTELGVDLLTLNGSKIYGPKGIGLLYIKEGVVLEPQILGGDQEIGVRSGTENVPLIVGLSTALVYAQQSGDNNSEVAKIRNYFWKELQNRISGVKLNGPLPGKKRIANNLSVCFQDIDADGLVLSLDHKGILCSTGSACQTNSAEPSHVLIACGLTPEEVAASVRFSLGNENTVGDIDYALEALSYTIDSMRKLKN